MSKYKFDPSSKKFNCPSCRKRRFVKLMDEQDNYLDSVFGKCDRINNCGYSKYPHGGEFSRQDSNFQGAPKEPSFITENVVRSSLKGYEINPYYQYMTSLYAQSEVDAVFMKYRVGTSLLWNGATIFWLTDLEGKVRSGKIMRCDPNSGHRIKERYSINWAHKMLKIQNFQLEQVLFGLHLLKDPEVTDLICIVESQKTALVMAIECPQYTWMATGSQVQLSYNMLAPLKNRTVILYPDSDAQDDWTNKAAILADQLPIDLRISSVVFEATKHLDQSKGYDLADLIIPKAD